MNVFKISVYATRAKKEPFSLWFDSLDETAQAIITMRIDRVSKGQLGDCKAIKGSKGVLELRIHYGPGYRVYFGKIKNTMIVLISGGDKKSQARDIEKAIQYWLDYQEML